MKPLMLLTLLLGLSSCASDYREPGEDVALVPATVQEEEEVIDSDPLYYDDIYYDDYDYLYDDDYADFYDPYWDNDYDDF
ncbi:MAG: hypothetical protein ACLGHN_13665 [Bacteriovoracia bacterium]